MTDKKPVKDQDCACWWQVKKAVSDESNCSSSGVGVCQLSSTCLATEHHGNNLELTAMSTAWMMCKGRTRTASRLEHPVMACLPGEFHAWQMQVRPSPVCGEICPRQITNFVLMVIILLHGTKKADGQDNKNWTVSIHCPLLAAAEGW